jgi:DnaJ-class molecular chaperone
MPEPTPEFDLYAELEVSARASTETIEAAWRSLAKRNHPDTVESRESGTARMKRLNQARDWLTDSGRRRRYDEPLRACGRIPDRRAGGATGVVVDAA